MTCGCSEAGDPEETWCGRDITDAPMIRRWQERMAQLLSDELGIDTECVRFTATTGCFNRPARGVVEVVGWSEEEREQTREVLTTLFRGASASLKDGSPNPQHDSEIERFWLRCWVALKERS